MEEGASGRVRLILVVYYGRVSTRTGLRGRRCVVLVRESLWRSVRICGEARGHEHLFGQGQVVSTLGATADARVVV